MALTSGRFPAQVLQHHQDPGFARAILKLPAEKPVAVVVNDDFADLGLVFGRLGWRVFYGLKTRFFIEEDQTATVEG